MKIEDLIDPGYLDYHSKKFDDFDDNLPNYAIRKTCLN